MSAGAACNHHTRSRIRVNGDTRWRDGISVLHVGPVVLRHSAVNVLGGLSRQVELAVLRALNEALPFVLGEGEHRTEAVVLRVADADDVLGERDFDAADIAAAGGLAEGRGFQWFAVHTASLSPVDAR